MGSGGTVEVKGGGTNLTIAPGDEEKITIPLGSLSYRSANSYWVDQTWTYQGGAIFLFQGESATVRVGPSIAATKKDATSGNINLDVALTRLEGSGMTSGSGPVRVETRMRPGSPLFIQKTGNYVVLTVEGDDPATIGAWKRVFDEVRGRMKEDSGILLDKPVLSADNKTVTFTINPGSGNRVFLTVHQARYTVTIYNAASLTE